MSYPVTPPYKQFSDLDGSPLDGGKIYFGSVNQNPETVPVTVYWDSGMTIPAAQPVSTLNGLIVRNGTPATLYAPSDFSITVRNSKNQIVYTAPQSPDLQLMTAVALSGLSQSSGSSLVGFIQAGTGAVLRTVQDKLREVMVSVKDFGAVGDGVTDDSAAIQAAINYAESLSTTGVTRGAVVYLPPGLYQVSSTLTVKQSRIAVRGAGRYRTYIRRKTNYGNTIEFKGSGLLEQMDLSGISFFHDISTSVVMVGMHIKWWDVNQGRISDILVENGQYGLCIYGGVDTVMEQVIAVGRNSATVGENGAVGILLDQAAGGNVVLPTQIRGHSVRCFGPRVAGWDIGLQINAAEDVTFDNSYFGNAKTHNVTLNQLSAQIILEVVFGAGCYFDGAGNHSVILTGTAGDGSTYIGNTKFIGCNFKGQGGDGPNGLFVDGTARAGAYPQAVRGLIVDACTFSAFSFNGIWVAGGNNITISNCQVCGNNYFNLAGGRGILVGATCDGVTISNCRIGRNPESSAVNGYQTAGIELVAGALNVVVIGNDLRYNVTALTDGLADAGTSKKRIINNIGFNEDRPTAGPAMPASTVDLFNPYGSPAWVSIFGGTLTSIKLNGQQISGATNTMFLLGPGDRVSITYTVAPSWVWWPM